jgi:hypothetical protein
VAPIHMNARSNALARLLCNLGCLFCLAACIKEQSVLERKRATSPTDIDFAAAGSGAPDRPRTTPPTVSAGSTGDVPPFVAQGSPIQPIPSARPIDLLFVVDDSSSMEREQAALRGQIPAMIQAITTGVLDGRSTAPIPDVQIGVVSADLGVAGVETGWPGCSPYGGDDGVFQHAVSTAPGCKAAYPPFLRFELGRDDPEQLAADFACMADLGFQGCVVKQPLEAALKALWPKSYTDAAGNTYAPEQNPVQFLSTSDERRFGHGDSSPNVGFLRNDTRIGPTTLAIVLITDSDDCSVRDTAGFQPSSDPANDVGPNVRCYHNKDNLFDLVRYATGYPMLKQDDESSVFFGAIVGVPADLVTADERAKIDWSDTSATDAYYEALLSDPRMQERPMNEATPSIAHLAPSCTRNDGARADAYPPRRIVEVAKAFGSRGIVQSICQDDFTPIVGAILERARSRP